MDAQWGKKKSWPISALMLLVSALLNLTGCVTAPATFALATLTPAVSDTPTLSPAYTLTPTPAASRTSTSVSTPTITPSQTVTILPSPTPVPEGFYYNHILQLKLMTPPGWKVAEKDKEVQFTDSKSKVTLSVKIATSDSVTADSILKMYVQIYQDPRFGWFASSTLGKKDWIVLGDGTTAVRQAITGEHSNGAGVAMQIACAKSGTRIYSFIFIGPIMDMQAMDNLLTRIYESIALGENSLSPPP